MDIWYARLAEDELLNAVRGAVAETAQKAKAAKKAKQATAGGKSWRSGPRRGRRNVARRPTPVTVCRRCPSSAKSSTGSTGSSASHRSSSRTGADRYVRLVPGRLHAAIHDQFRAYRATLPADLRHLLDRFQVMDAARKVVGVGSVGTRAFIVLLQGRDEHDPLFLQVKEATASVLEAYLPHEPVPAAGERVVQGQRLMQAASDIYLGWTKGLDERRNFYWRQLRDMKGSALVEG